MKIYSFNVQAKEANGFLLLDAKLELLELKFNNFISRNTARIVMMIKIHG